jgi:hypothetical protein
MALWDSGDFTMPGWKDGPSVISTSKFHDRVVDDYLALVKWTQQDAEKINERTGFVPNQPNVRSVQSRFNSRAHRMLREHLRDARIFEVQSDLFVPLDREVDLYLTEQLAGVEWRPSEYQDTPYGRLAKDPTISLEERFKYIKACRKALQAIGVPNPRPFDTMWLGMGSMVSLASRLHAVQDSFMVKSGTTIIKAPSIVGILIADDYCAEVNTCTVNYRGDQRESLLIIPLWQDEMWLSPELGHPWLLNALVEIFNQQDTLITELPVIDKRKFSQRRWWQQKVKKTGIKGIVLPPMYYTVTIKPSTQQDKMKLAMQGSRNWTHRWDVRGHKITKATGGMKPIDPRVRASLLQRGYTIIEDPDDLTDEQAAVLMRHKKSFPNNVLWAAMKIGFRRDFIKGPADKPYIPAAWRLEKNRNG